MKGEQIMKQKLQFYFVSVFFLMSTAFVNGQVRITEVMSSASGEAGTVGAIDWFEVTNLGATEVDITGWKVDDGSFAFATALALNGVIAIPAGKSVIFMETAAPATDVAAFKAFWGTSLDAVSVGSYSGSGISLSSNGDGVALFRTDGTEVTRVTFSAATSGSSFYWSYSATGSVISTAVVSTLGTINGTVSNQVTLTSANVIGNIGSPGTAIIFPLSSNVNNPNYKNWSLVGKTLKFDILPTTKVEIYALTGSKVAVFEAAKEIELNLSRGIYMLKFNDKASKFMKK